MSPATTGAAPAGTARNGFAWCDVPSISKMYDFWIEEKRQKLGGESHHSYPLVFKNPNDFNVYTLKTDVLLRSTRKTDCMKLTNFSGREVLVTQWGEVERNKREEKGERTCMKESGGKLGQAPGKIKSKKSRRGRVITSSQYPQTLAANIPGPRFFNGFLHSPPLHSRTPRRSHM